MWSAPFQKQIFDKESKHKSCNYQNLLKEMLSN